MVHAYNVREHFNNGTMDLTIVHEGSLIIILQGKSTGDRRELGEGKGKSQSKWNCIMEQ